MTNIYTLWCAVLSLDHSILKAKVYTVFHHLSLPTGDIAGTFKMCFTLDLNSHAPLTLAIEMEDLQYREYDELQRR